jgi:hypothetical protein
LIVIPANPEGLALSMKHTHGRYASYWNVIHNSIGHVCPTPSAGFFEL